MSKPVTTETTSPSDTIGSDEDENETVDESGGWNGKEDEYEDDVSAEEGEGEVSESDPEEHETTEQRNRYLQPGRRPAPAATRPGNGEYDSMQDDDDDDEEEDDEGTINGDEEEEEEEEEAMDEDDAQSRYSNSSRSDEDSDDPEKVDPSVAEEMENFEATFRGFSKRFRLINKIGEGGTLPSKTTAQC